MVVSPSPTDHVRKSLGHCRFKHFWFIFHHIGLLLWLALPRTTCCPFIAWLFIMSLNDATVVGRSRCLKINLGCDWGNLTYALSLGHQWQSCCQLPAFWHLLPSALPCATAAIAAAAPAATTFYQVCALWPMTTTWVCLVLHSMSHCIFIGGM